MVSYYYTLPQEKERDCEKFNLNVQVLPRNFATFSFLFIAVGFFCNGDAEQSLPTTLKPNNTWLCLPQNLYVILIPLSYILPYNDSCIYLQNTANFCSINLYS